MDEIYNIFLPRCEDNFWAIVFRWNEIMHLVACDVTLDL